MNISHAQFSQDQLEHFCSRWQIIELALFGSFLTDRVRFDSDVDLLVTFAEDTHWSLLDHVQMEDELEKIFGRPVDLVAKKAVEQSYNWLLRQEILNSAQVIFRAYETIGT